MKKVLFVFIICALCFALCGCATVRYSITIMDGGARKVEYTVTLDDGVTADSKEVASVKCLFEYLKSNNDHAQVIYDENKPNEIIYSISYSSQTEYYQALGITGDEPNVDPLPYENKGMFREYEAVVLEVDRADFASYALMYLNYYEDDLQEILVQGLTDAAKNASDGLAFVIRGIKNDEDVVGALRRELAYSGLKDDLTLVTYKILKDAGYDYMSVLAYFDYSHVYDSVVGVDADSVQTVSGQKVYTWNLDPFAKNEIKVTQTAPNVWIWEVIAICVGVCVVTVGAVCLIVAKNKSAKKNGNKAVVAKDGDVDADVNDMFDFNYNKHQNQTNSSEDNDSDMFD